MDSIQHFLRRNTTLSAIFASNLLLSLHYYLIIYVNSSYLSGYFSEKNLSFLYAGGAFLNLLLFLFSPRIIRKMGVYHFLLLSIVLEGIAIGGLIYANSALSAGFFFTIHQVIVSMILLSFDVFLEAVTNNEGHTGKLRSVYLTLANATLVVSPALVGLLLVGNNYGPIYTVSALLIIPLLLLVIGTLRDVKVNPPEHVQVLESLRGMWKHSNIRWVTGAHLVLQVFYAWMVIYTPIYLHDHIGFDWNVIGVLFTIMLLPFILFEIPVGKLADDRFGEKEFMIFGFIVMALSLFLFPLVTYPSFAIWASILFLTRVGASIVEITSESYFFKQVAGNDSDWISIFRGTRSVGYIVGPLCASASIVLFSFPMMFPALACICLTGIVCAKKLIDTR